MSSVPAPHAAPGPSGAIPRRGARVVSGVLLAVAVLALLAGVGGVAAALTADGGTVPVLVGDREAVEFSVDGIPPGVEVLLDGASRAELAGTRSLDLALAVDDLPASLRVLAALPMALAATLTALGAFVLRRVLVDIASGRPFAPANPQRIALLAVLAVASALLPGLVASGATIAVLEHLGVAGPDGPFGFTILQVSSTPLLLAAVLGVVAGVFRHGQRLTDDVAGLV